MPATLDDIASLLRELTSEVRLARLTWEASQRGPLAPEDDTEDPKVSFDPKTWNGPSFKGLGYSRCPPEFLDHLARALTQMAKNEQEERKTYRDKPAYVYTLQKAARARRWALRKRTGWTPPERSAISGEAGHVGIAATGIQTGGIESAGISATGIGESTILGTAKLGAPKDAVESEDDSFNFGANVRDEEEDDLSL